jgi:exodeoxyribonuclease V alpha subunit
LDTTIPSNLKLEVIIKKIIYISQKNSWVVACVEEQEQGSEIIATGHLAHPNEEEYYCLDGKWYDHHSYGKQFKFEQATLSEPKSKKAITTYLSSDLFPGIGKKTAEKIVQRFGEKSLEVLDKTPEKLKTISSLDHRKINKILSVWNERKQTAEIFVFLYKHGIGAKTAQKIIEEFGLQTTSIIKANPYLLSENIKGIAFLTADRMGQSLGIPPDSIYRIEQGILYILKLYQDKGHCYIQKEQLQQQMLKHLQLTPEQIAEKYDTCIDNLNDKVYIVSEKKQDTTIHYLKEIFLAEQELAKKIQQHIEIKKQQDPVIKEKSDEWLKRYCEQSQIKFSQQQEQAVKGCVFNNFFIITGGPGVGKTTIAKAIIKMFKAMKKSVLLAAPTGRAAKRMNEVTGDPSKTIHRLLEWSASERRFLKSEKSPINCQVLIIDESSMIDIKLGHQLLRAISPLTQVVWIGDVDQLPSVGPGKVLYDLLSCPKIPNIKLTTVYRQALGSKIITNAHAINQGNIPTFENKDQDDCFFLEAHTDEQIHNTIEDLIQNSLTKAGYDTLKDIQILTPLNKGSLGGQTLNDRFQNILNPKSSNNKELSYGKKTFRSEDKVIQLQNNYDLGIFNGDIGFIKSIEKESSSISVDFGDKIVQLSGEQLDDLALAYAITIHKAQGSEFPAIIIPISMKQFIMLEKNLIYTALTRAKKIAIFVGEKKALAYAIKNKKNSLRQTSLGNII